MAKWIDGRLSRGALLALACLLAALAAVTLASGCGGTGDEQASATARRVVPIQRAARDRWTYARARFNEMCAGCHTLADAGARGRRFNLDVAAGVDENHVRYVIAEGEPGMPAWRDVLSRREYAELVAYVVAVARHENGEDDWHWQIKLRMEGERWSPTDARRLRRETSRYAAEARRHAAEQQQQGDSGR